MSDFDSKLSRSIPSQGTKARATLAQLRKRLGAVESAEDEATWQDKTPGAFRVVSMGKEEIWKRISGRGESAIFELQS